MWIFLPGGLLMPAAVPEGKADTKFTKDGLYDLQVRARVKSHLENFIRDYMLDDTYSEIHATPGMDYNFRFYTTREIFAQALSGAVEDIDYTKFKPTAEDRDADGNPLYKDGKDYHSVLNSIWGTVTRLGSPGGLWGTYTGKKHWWGKSTSAYSGRRYDDILSDRDRISDDVSDSDRLADRWLREDALDAHWLEEDGPEGGVPAYIPSEADRRTYLLDLVDGIPASQWDDWLSREEIALIQDVFDREQARERRADRKARKRRPSKPQARRQSAPSQHGTRAR